MGLVDLTKTEVKRILRDLEAPFLSDKEGVRRYRRLVRKLKGITKQKRL